MSRLTKLKAMSVREIAHRVGYRAYTTCERALHARGYFARAGRLRAGLVPELRSRSSWTEELLHQRGTRAFFALDARADDTRRLMHDVYAAELVRSRDIAARVARHEIAFFGETFRFGPDINWHADPVSGAEWPRRYHRDVLARGEGAFGDVKHVWELNRHQFLIDLAKVAFVDRSRQHAADVEALLDSWFDAAPYGTGAPWACALEPAFRVWSWLWAYHMLRAGGLLSSRAHTRWLESFL
ncbi:MAG TPA: hypothetical protein VFS49_01665, partial [Croceibacterium sp.]|nr:hypothetical protein [Croceibacterium sp.]